MIRFVLRHGIWLPTVAVWLLLLAVSPCTAPFSTVDLLPLGPAAPLDPGKVKNANDELIAASRVSVMAQIVEMPAISPLAATAMRDSLASQHTILRL